MVFQVGTKPESTQEMLRRKEFEWSVMSMQERIIWINQQIAAGKSTVY